MSRRPPVPPANRPTHGPDATPKTAVDITHRVRRLARAPHAPEPQPETGQHLRVMWLLVAGMVGYAVRVSTMRR